MTAVGTQTLVYAPQVRVLVSTDDGVLDISEDIVNGQVRRVINAVSQFSCVLNNRDQKYMNSSYRMKRMDRVVVWFKRITWIQVFSGYLDSVPGIGIYVNTVQIRASCTLKRIQNTYWDPGLSDSQQLLDQFNYNIAPNGLRYSDSGLGAMLGDLLFKVGGWKEDTIKVQNIPSAFIDLGFKMSQIEYNQNLVTQYYASLGFKTSPDGQNLIASPQTTLKAKVSPPANGKNYGTDDVTTICRAAGFDGDNLKIAVAIVTTVSDGNPNIVNKTFNGFTAVNKVGLFQIDDTIVSPGLGVADAQLLDPLFNSQQAFSIFSKSSNFSYWPAFTSGQYLKNMAVATFYADQSNTNIIQNVVVPDTGLGSSSGISVADAQNGSVNKSISTNPSAGYTSARVATVTIPRYTNSATSDYLKNIYGLTADAVDANIIQISFIGQTIKVNRYAAAAFLKVSTEIDALNTEYIIKSISTITSLDDANSPDASAGLSWHALGIAVDINPSKNAHTAGSVNGAHDIPASWVAVFQKNNFSWGGDYNNWTHFQWLGGSTFTPNDGTFTEGQISLTSSGAFQNGMFNYLFSGDAVNRDSTAFQNDKAPINDQQLFSTVQSICSASLRSFMSGPNGDFVAFYPDRFGLSGKKIAFHLEDIELVNFSIDINDDSLATDVFVAGGNKGEIGNPQIDTQTWLQSAGVVNIRQKAAMALILGIDIETDPDFNAVSLYKRFGLRPLKAEYPQVYSGVMEYLQALNLFQQKWGEQYATTVQFTFMPELYPGMRVGVKSHSVAVFIEDVTHSFGYDTGFTTTATISSPSSLVDNGGVRGLPISKL